MDQFKYACWVLMFVAVTACGPAITNTLAPRTDQTPSPISTEQIFALTKMSGLTSEAQTATAVSPKNNATLDAIMATKYAGATQMAETITAAPSETPASPASKYLTQIKMFDETHGWLVAGADGVTRRILHTDDGGLTWKDSTPNEITFVGSGIYFLDSKAAWVPAFVGAQNAPVIFQTVDAGVHWAEYQQLPFKDASPDKQFALKFFDPLNGLAIADQGVSLGHFGFTLYQTADGGKNWTQLFLAKSLNLKPESGLPDGTLFISDDKAIEFLNPSTAWFGGNQLEYTQVVVLQASRDGGKTWKNIPITVPIPDGVGSDILAAYSLPVFITEKDAYLIVGYSTSSNLTISVLMLTHDGGETWTASPALLNNSEWNLHLKFVTPKDGFYHCGFSLCVTHDGAQTWQMVSSNVIFGYFGNSGLTMWGFVNTATGWAILDEDGVSKLVKTIDGGKNWITLQ